MLQPDRIFHSFSNTNLFLLPDYNSLGKKLFFFLSPLCFSWGMAVSSQPVYLFGFGGGEEDEVLFCSLVPSTLPALREC